MHLRLDARDAQPGTGLESSLPATAGVGLLPTPRTWPARKLPGAATHRNPMLLFWFVGLLLLRFAARKLLSLLFQLPPRSTLESACPYA